MENNANMKEMKKKSFTFQNPFLLTIFTQYNENADLIKLNKDKK